MSDLRRFLRLAREYRLEYGPFPPLNYQEPLKGAAMRNIGGGGLSFISSEDFPIGRQLLLKIYVPGWRLEGDDIIETRDDDQEALITAIAEVTRCQSIPNEEKFEIGLKFLGRVLNQ